MKEKFDESHKSQIIPERLTVSENLEIDIMSIPLEDLREGRVVSIPPSLMNNRETQMLADAEKYPDVVVGPLVAFQYGMEPSINSYRYRDELRMGFYADTNEHNEAFDRLRKLVDNAIAKKLH